MRPPLRTLYVSDDAIGSFRPWTIALGSLVNSGDGLFFLNFSFPILKGLGLRG